MLKLDYTMEQNTYSFYKIPKVVFSDSNLSPCSKLVFAYLSSREAYFVNTMGYPKGSFFQCYLRTLANQVGRSTDSVRKCYIPELIATGYIEKKNISGCKDDNRNTLCLYRIKWETIVNGKKNETDK